MFNIKALAMATAVSAGVILAMPVASQAMPASSPVKIQTANDGNIVDVRYYRYRTSWARYCAYHNDWRCHRRHYSRYYRYRYYEPYYGYYPYYRPYRPYYYGPGIGLHFGIY